MILYANDNDQETHVNTVDPASVNGPYTFELHPNTLANEPTPSDNARIIVAARTKSVINVTFVSDDIDPARTILDPDTFLPVTTYSTRFEGSSIEFVYRASVNQWLVLHKPRFRFDEIWQATPIEPPGAPGGIAGQTIQWTHVPLGGRPALLFHELDGVLTYQSSVTLPVTVLLTQDTAVNIASNNSDVTWDYAPIFSGSGPSTLSNYRNAFAHPRVATFDITGQQIGIAEFSNGDTLSYLANAAGTGGSTADLTNAFLLLTIDN